VNISYEKLAAETEATGFRSDVLEKVARLLGLLGAIRSHPFLKGKLVLKGGTALNLFVFEAPRLSVDIDLNYVGAEERDGMLVDRPLVEQALQAVFAREGLTVRRMPEEHAGGKWSLRYKDATGRNGNLEVDINFMFRNGKLSTCGVTRNKVRMENVYALARRIRLLPRGYLKRSESLA
jgi:predicted nucleotidyltransferase component of viral defense system